MCGKSVDLTPSSTCSCSDKHSPSRSQTDDTMSRLGTAAAAGTVAGAAAGVTHTILTRLYTIMTLRRVIDSIVHKNNELGDAVQTSDLLSADRASIKAALVTINDILNSVEDKIDELKSKIEPIKAQMEIIKAKLNGQMPEMLRAMGQTYSRLKPAFDNADPKNINKQSVGAGLAVGGVTLLGSFFARPIQTAIENYLNPSSSTGQLGSSQKCGSPDCRAQWGMKSHGVSVNNKGINTIEVSSSNY